MYRIKIFLAVASAFAWTLSSQADLYVDPVHGNNTNSGVASDQAFASIEKARDTIRTKKLNQNLSTDLTVWLRQGRYELNDTLLFDARDSGSGGHSVVYRAYQNEKPVICGGRRVTGWTAVPGKPYFVASVPSQKPIPLTRPKDDDDLYPPPLHPRHYKLQTLADEGFAAYFAQLYVNGVRAERARTSTTLTSSRNIWWDDPSTPEFRDGIYVRKLALTNYTNPQDLRVLWVEGFKIADVPVTEILPAGPDEVILKMKQPGFNLCSGWDRIQPQTPFFLVNALEELDEPGEWYLDQKHRLVYYYPFKRDGDLNQAEVYAPRVEFLMRVAGSPIQPVHDLRFEGLTFQHGNWTGAKDEYLGLSQAEIFKTYSSEIPGQVILNCADNIAVVGCTVRHMGSCGIQLYEGCHNILLEGNVTYDTTGAGITIGRWWINPRYCLPETICTNIIVRDNVVRDTGRDYWQATGINLFAAWQVLVCHNDISDTAYTALHARIGATSYIHPRIGNIKFQANKVSRALQGHKWGIGDGGHLYLHGRYPGSEVSSNYSLYANQNVNLEYYSDNFSHTIRWMANISRFTQARSPYGAWHPGNVDVIFDNNYSDKPCKRIGNARQTNFHLITNDQWPPEARRIMDDAGLEPQWRHLATSIYGHENLAQGRPCWASSEMDSQHAASAAADGNWSSFWHSRPDAPGATWWKVDLGAPYVIQRVTLMPRQDMYEEAAQKNIEVQASNDPDFKNYVVLCEQNSVPWYRKPSNPKEGVACSNMWEKYLPIMAGYRYLRVTSTVAGSSLSLAEFAAYGYLAAGLNR